PQDVEVKAEGRRDLVQTQFLQTQEVTQLLFDAPLLKGNAHAVCRGAQFAKGYALRAESPKNIAGTDASETQDVKGILLSVVSVEQRVMRVELAATESGAVREKGLV